jgi:hypothetical protein
VLYLSYTRFISTKIFKANETAWINNQRLESHRRQHAGGRGGTGGGRIPTPDPWLRGMSKFAWEKLLKHVENMPLKS